KELYKDSIAIFLMPPSLDVLECRLRGRGTEDEDDLMRRLEIAKFEIEKSCGYDYIVINDSLEEAAEEIINILNKLK
ncbi:MAG: guanylate kinase, partial [Oscillospiraceae bacterium]